MRTITLSPKQQVAAEILTRLEAQVVGTSEAAQLLGLTPRQVRRLRARFQQEGFACLIHGNAGRSPANRTDPAVAARILELAGPGGKYHDLNVCHLQEFLADREHISIGRSTLDRLLRQAGLRQAQTAPPLHRRRRERRAAEGMLLQIDASPFDWLERRGPKATLIGAIDDATGKVVFLRFQSSEDQVAYLLLLRGVATNFGLPMSIYHDRHTILRSPKQPTLEEQLAGKPPMSQIQRVMALLGIESIPAHSPQAKGRIERLWGTLQDRLTKELRLEGITTSEQANAFLPGFIDRFNARFAKPAQDPDPAWVPLPEGLDLSYHFAVRETRKVRADHCISFEGQLLQLLPKRNGPSLVGETVAVHVVPEGEIHLYRGKDPVPFEVVPAPVPMPAKQPAKEARLPRPAQPKATARQRAWLFAKP